METMTDELCAYWREDDWCGCYDVPRTTPRIRCPFASDDVEQKTFCKFYNYNVIQNNHDGTFSIILNGKELISNIEGEDVVLLRYVLGEFDDAKEL
jgi:hypothetical protein